MTPVSAGALGILQNLIKQDVHALDEASKRKLERHIQKIVNAAHTSFSRNSLLEERTEFLTTIDNDAKVRRSTKSVVLRKAKVMSFKDLEKARTDRAAKDEAKVKRKGTRGRSKDSVLEAEENAVGKKKRSEAQKC
jgi:hypothetical protein